MGNDEKHREPLNTEKSSGTRDSSDSPRATTPPDLTWQSRGQGFESPQLHGERRHESPATAGDSVVVWSMRELAVAAERGISWWVSWSEPQIGAGA